MSSLYPTPKTQQQRDEDDRLRQERLRQRLPKAPWLTVPLFGALVFWIAVRFIDIFPDMWSTAHIAFVFFSFALWLGVAGLVIWWAVYTHRMLYKYGASRLVFWVGYAVTLLILFGLHTTGVTKGEVYHLPYTGMLYVTLLVLSLLLFRKKWREKK
ncbi:hypothetical protein KI440_02455 [Candidatus Saccharibacteria bacterium TM7i]|nr:hypothetical protein KI440_02455 [Candidatus Saccharibacteria bacterium TM7i]